MKKKPVLNKDYQRRVKTPDITSHKKRANKTKKSLDNNKINITLISTNNLKKPILKKTNYINLKTETKPQKKTKILTNEEKKEEPKVSNPKKNLAKEKRPNSATKKLFKNKISKKEKENIQKKNNAMMNKTGDNFHKIEIQNKKNNNNNNNIGKQRKKSVDIALEKRNKKTDKGKAEKIKNFLKIESIKTKRQIRNKTVDIKIHKKVNKKKKENEIKNDMLNKVKDDVMVKKEKINSQEKKNLRDICRSIASSLPKRQKTNYSSLKDIMKSKTENLSQREKSFIIFLWISDNISYDVDSYFAGRSVDCTPEGVFKNGSSVCLGYARLFKDISDYLNLEVECVDCYAKGVSYEVGDEIKSPNHEYNVIKLDNKWYPIDSTWGAGHTDGKKFIKSYNEFYFFANPELLIKTHFPVNDKWQLTQKKYTLDEFLNWPYIKSQFYTFGFEKCLPDKGLIELKDSNNQKFIIYGNDMNKKGATCDVYLLEGNTYKQRLNTSCINFYNDRFEVDTIFNEKGKYKVQIYGNKERGNSYIDMLEYTVNVENDAKKKLSFPLFYSGKEDINVIEPFYDNLKSGENVKFKIKFNLDEIIIIDEKWHRLKKMKKDFLKLKLKLNQ